MKHMKYEVIYKYKIIHVKLYILYFTSLSQNNIKLYLQSLQSFTS